MHCNIDFDVVENPVISFKEKFRRENTNEIGQVINEDTAEVIILEFRKFLFCVAKEMAASRRKHKNKYLKPVFYNDKTLSYGYTSLLSASPLIDKVWRSLIGYERKYKEICYKIFYGYLVREEPRADFPLAYENYKKLKQVMKVNQDKLHPFPNLWPDYQSCDEFSKDYKYNVWVSLSRLEEFKQFIGNGAKEAGEINSLYCIRRSQEMHDAYQRQFPPECQGRPSYDDDKFTYASEVNEVWSNQRDDEYVYSHYKEVMKFNFPETLVTHVADELMISEQQAEDIIYEYRRFMMIEGMTNYKLYPSEAIEKVWLIHMGYGKNYIEFCKKSPEEQFIYHIPFTGNSNGYDDRECYKSTLDVYKIVFRENPPTSVWPNLEIRFHPENFN